MANVGVRRAPNAMNFLRQMEVIAKSGEPSDFKDRFVRSLQGHSLDFTMMWASSRHAFCVGVPSPMAQRGMEPSLEGGKGVLHWETGERSHLESANKDFQAYGRGLARGHPMSRHAAIPHTRGLSAGFL